jgi:tRNA(fMet)-specific endonuclease VapC
VGSALYLLDTNTLSFLVNGRSRAVRRNYVEAENQGARIAISAITEAEALFGLAKRPEATRLRANFDRFFAAVELLPWDSTVARAYGALRAELSATGKSLALMDLLIASHAIAAGATLVTHDKAFLHASSSLKVVDWATDL